MLKKNVLIILLIFGLTGCTVILEIKSRSEQSDEVRPSERSGIFPLYTSEQQPIGLDGYYDLDNAHDLADTEGDILYTMSEQPELVDCLVPANGAKMFVWGDEEPTKVDCLGVRWRMNKRGDCDPEIGEYYCILTNEKYVARVQILSIDESYIDSLVVGERHIFMLRFSFNIWYE